MEVNASAGIPFTGKFTLIAPKKLGREDRCFPCKADSRFSSKALLRQPRLRGRPGSSKGGCGA
jgi:hypothetical protein